jgi:hypothetical protein
MRAAGQGHAKAQLMLAEIWANGRGVPRKDVLAYKWAYLAKQYAAEPHIRESAEILLGSLANHLSAAEIVEARETARQWRPELESSSANPSETVTSGDPGTKVQTETSRPPRARKYFGSHTGKRTRTGAAGPSQIRTIRAHLNVAARQLGF